MAQLEKIRSWALLHFANLALEIIASQQEKLRGQQRHPLLAPGAGGVPGVRYAAAQMQVRTGFWWVSSFPQQKSIWVFPKIGGFFPPNHPIFNRDFPLFAPSILGEKPYFWKHPYEQRPIWHKFVWREQMEQNDI